MIAEDARLLAQNVLDLARAIVAFGDEGTLTLSPNGVRWLRLNSGFGLTEAENVARAGKRAGVFEFFRPTDERGYPTIIVSADVNALTVDGIAEGLV